MKLRGFEFITAYKSLNMALPMRKTGLSAGYDIAAAETVCVAPREVVLIPTGLKAYMQADEYLGIHIRSSLSVKSNLMLANSEGIIDADYYNNPSNEGHILIALRNLGDEEVLIQRGERIAQGIFCKFLTTDYDLEVENQKRTGGFGSTGNS